MTDVKYVRGLYQNKTELRISIIKKDNLYVFIKFKEGVKPIECKHQKNHPIKFYKRPETDALTILLKGLDKFKDSNLDFYEIIYSGIKPSLSYFEDKEELKIIHPEEISRHLSKTLNPS